MMSQLEVILMLEVWGNLVSNCTFTPVLEAECSLTPHIVDHLEILLFNYIKQTQALLKWEELALAYNFILL